MHAPAPYRPCPVCDGTAAKALSAYSPEPWNMAECAGCAMVYLRNPPDYEALKEDFAWEKSYSAKKESDRHGSTFLSPLARRLRHGLKTHRNRTGAFRRWFRNGKVLDVGCGGGGRILPPMTPYGIELSSGLFEHAQRNMAAMGGFAVQGPGAEAIWEFDEGFFDGIVMYSYLEHETNPLRVLKGAHRALKDDGAVFVRVPNYGSLNRRVIGPKWCGFRYPDHVNYFTPGSLRDIAARAGFTTRIVNWLNVAVDDNVSVLLRKSKTQN